MSNIPTAEEFMTDEYQIKHYGTVLTKPTQAAIEFAKLHVQAQNKAIIENVEIIDYDELSGGEKQLCNVAMAFAMNEALTASKGINLAFLDEVFESLSSDNVEVVTSLIRHIFKEKTLFLITHLDSLPLGNTKILQVEKTQGLSRYQLL